MRRSPPSVTRTTRSWVTKSNSSVKAAFSCGISGVTRPRAETRSVTCQPWLSQGVCESLTFPTICDHRCRVSTVGRIVL